MSGRPSGAGSATPAGSQRGSSQAGSPTRGSKSTGFVKVDPARDRPKLTPTELIGKRVDLPADAYNLGKGDARFSRRPGFVSDGKAIKVQLNLFPVVNWLDRDIYQYDVVVAPNPKESSALVKKVWNTKTVTAELKKKGGMWLCDGNKLAWSSQKIDLSEMRITVDLDSLLEKPEAAHPDVAKRITSESVYYLKLTHTVKVRLGYLKSYLQGQISWDSHVLACMNFFDHCLRQWPSENWLTIKRNIYDPNAKLSFLANDLVVNQGIYCAPRLSENIGRKGTGLTINVDRCFTAFWPGDEFLSDIALHICQSQKDEWQGWTLNQLSSNLQHKEVMDQKSKSRHVVPSDAFLLLRRMAKLKFTVVNRTGERPKIYTVKRIVFEPSHGTKGSTAMTVTFDKKMPDETTRKISVYDHYYERYNFKLRWPKLPILETTRGQLFPMEMCKSISHQRYPYKLNPAQTSDMIKVAVSRPPKRSADIMEGVNQLKWREDPYLKAFGITIDPHMVVSDARLLQNPEVAFANGKINPGTTGRWDLRGKKFLEPNSIEMTSWGIFGCGDDRGSCRQAELENFGRTFSQIYRNHGGRISKPPIIEVIPWSVGDYSKVCEHAMKRVQNASGLPQIIFFVLPTKNQLAYERIKKNMDCRFNIVSQCLQAAHVRKAQGQYASNVAMKVNSKLGGVTCRVPHPIQKDAARPTFWSKPTLMIGLDVSHGAPGSQQPSMAALTMSMDKNATRFAASCQTNGYRREVAEADCMHSLLPKLIKTWMNSNKTAPHHVYYLRDGVSEGQFQAVIDTEVLEMKRIFRDAGCANVKFTVIIATKRHHVRFFPKPNDRVTTDRNGNSFPGTLVERDATHPQHFDFYLCSHAAIQGTARPVHYQVILDEEGVKPNDLVKMIYQQCYQYCRSTTPVSLHPAVYYSHLASNRARSHESLASDQQILGYGKPGFPYGKESSEIYSGSKDQAPPLIAMDDGGTNRQKVQFINTTMWYV
ncbi:hypothetical protein M426DRAFT_25033 [Hypoxylon sp. CI-4A]|nr:hypothetical protein M426DRAFT_25033 [Hypoxylon sp. CI-4A]